MNTEEKELKSAKWRTDNLGKNAVLYGVVQRTFRAYNKEGVVKLQSTASTMEEAIQKTYDVLGDYATLYDYRWVD
jgi:predicted metal-dependent hydrolase